MYAEGWEKPTPPTLPLWESGKLFKSHIPCAPLAKWFEL